MNPSTILDDIKNNPIIAIIAILAVAGIWVWSKGRTATGTATPASATVPIVQTLPVDQNGNVIQPVGVTNQFTSYPIIQTLPGTVTNVPPPGPVEYKHPAASDPTNGMSTNFWVYTSKPTDTLAYINSEIGHWGQHPASFFANYRNNAEILASYGIDPTNYSKALPGGIQFSV